MSTHIEDHSIGWWQSIEYLTRSSTCERPTVVECVICRWVGLKERKEHAESIVIGGFERRYNPNSINKEFINGDGPKLFIRTESS